MASITLSEATEWYLKDLRLEGEDGDLVRRAIQERANPPITDERVMSLVHYFLGAFGCQPPQPSQRAPVDMEKVHEIVLNKVRILGSDLFVNPSHRDYHIIRDSMDNHLNTITTRVIEQATIIERAGVKLDFKLIKSATPFLPRNLGGLSRSHTEFRKDLENFLDQNRV